MPKPQPLSDDTCSGPMTPLASMSAPLTLSHRGFALQIRFGADGYSYVIDHAGLTLHAAADFRSAGAADRAARRFVDDALGAFAHAEAELAA